MKLLLCFVSTDKCGKKLVLPPIKLLPSYSAGQTEDKATEGQTG